MTLPAPRLLVNINDTIRDTLLVEEICCKTQLLLSNVESMVSS